LLRGVIIRKTTGLSIALLREYVWKLWRIEPKNSDFVGIIAIHATVPIALTMRLIRYARRNITNPAHVPTGDNS
jgi:hypothetical protein